MSDEDENCDCREDPNFNKRHQSFHVFTSPLDMERFFNQQMDDMLKSFGFLGAFTDKNNEETFPGSKMPELYQGKGQEYDDKNESGERDFMLKKDHDEKLQTPGYIPQATEKGNFWAGSRESAKDNPKTDKDLDQNGINSAELDKLFKHPQSSGVAESTVQTPFGDWNNGTGSLFGHFFRNAFPNRTPFEQLPNDEHSSQNWSMQSFSYSQSSSHRKVQQPDGSMEEHSDTTDNEGNRVKKLTKTRRDGEWHCRVCVTKPGKNEECQDDSSPGYQNELEDNYVDNLDKKFQGTERDDLSDRGRFSGGQNERNYNPRDEMLRGEQKSYNSLFDRFFGGR